MSELDAAGEALVSVVGELQDERDALKIQFADAQDRLALMQVELQASEARERELHGKIEELRSAIEELNPRSERLTRKESVVGAARAVLKMFTNGWSDEVWKRAERMDSKMHALTALREALARWDSP